MMKPEGRDDDGLGDDNCQSEMSGTDTHPWPEHATTSQSGLVAHFSPDGNYVLQEHVVGDELSLDAITVVAQGGPPLTTDQLAELHRLLAARAPCYAAANHEDKERIVALTYLDIGSALVRDDEEEHLFRLFLETGDFNC